jgi:hypothetical protein
MKHYRHLLPAQVLAGSPGLTGAGPGLAQTEPSSEGAPNEVKEVLVYANLPRLFGLIFRYSGGWALP